MRFGSRLGKRMSRPDLGQLMTVLANIGVIAGIVFLGFEIRQNTLVSRGAALQGIAEQVVEFQLAAALDDDWIRIITFLDGGGTYSKLSPEDRLRYGWLVGVSVRIMELRYRQAQLGIIDASTVDVHGGKANVAWYRSDHFRAYWQDVDQTVLWTPDFVEFMEVEVLAIR